MERDVVRSWGDAGFEAERVPLSGGAGGSFTGDVLITLGGAVYTFECKARSNGFKQIYEWLGDHYGLVIKHDRKERLVVLRESDLQEILRK